MNALIGFLVFTLFYINTGLIIIQFITKIAINEGVEELPRETEMVMEFMENNVLLSVLLFPMVTLFYYIHTLRNKLFK